MCQDSCRSRGPTEGQRLGRAFPQCPGNPSSDHDGSQSPGKEAGGSPGLWLPSGALSWPAFLCGVLKAECLAQGTQP